MFWAGMFAGFIKIMPKLKIFLLDLHINTLNKYKQFIEKS